MININETFTEDEIANAERYLTLGVPFLLTESGRLFSQIQSKNPFIIITGYHPGLSKEENKNRNARLLLYMRQQELRCRKILGIWKATDDNGDKSEHSEQFFFIPFKLDPAIKSGEEFFEWAVEIAHIFEQDAIIYGSGKTVFLVVTKDGNSTCEIIGAQTNIHQSDIEKALSDFSGRSRIDGKDFVFEYYSIDVPDCWMLSMVMGYSGVNV